MHRRPIGVENLARLVILICCTITLTSPGRAEESSPDATVVDELKSDLDELRRRDVENRQKIEAIEKKIESLQKSKLSAPPATGSDGSAASTTSEDSLADALDEAMAELDELDDAGPPPGAPTGTPVGGMPSGDSASPICG